MTSADQASPPGGATPVGPHHPEGPDTPTAPTAPTAPSRGVPWSRTTHLLLHLTGLALAVFTLFTVLRMPDMTYHLARDAELRATYDTYLETGVPLIKVNGTGSYYGALPGEGLTKAAGDDDPGSYLVATWMSHLTGSASPYPGLRIAMAVLAALPMLLLPMTMARIFRRARAGFAMVLLPLVTLLVNGTVLTGTEYGLVDRASGTPVYALYGLPASMIFLCLVLVATAVARRPGVRAAVAWSLGLVVLASCTNLLRSLSGVGVALAVGVVWWVAWSGRLRAAVAAAAAAVSLVGAMWLPGLAMDLINQSRDKVVLAESSAMTDTHGKWHNPYLGLSWPEPVNGQASEFDVLWSDEFGWGKAREVDPNVVVGSAQYDRIMRGVFLDEVRAAPWKAVKLYAEKSLYVVQHFAAMLLVIAAGAVLVWRRSRAHRPVLRQLGAASMPTVLLGLVPTVLVMPLLYYYTELAAGLGFLLALAVGALGWTLTTLGTADEDAEGTGSAGRTGGTGAAERTGGRRDAAVHG